MTTACVGEVLVLVENITYIIEFPGAISSSELGRLQEIGYDPVNATTGMLSFRNFVGSTRLAGVQLQIKSSKLGDDGVSGLLEQVSNLSASLVFGWKAPTGYSANNSDELKSPISYHQLQFLREAMLPRRKASGSRSGF